MERNCKLTNGNHSTQWRCFTQHYALVHFLWEHNVSFWLLSSSCSHPNCTCPTYYAHISPIRHALPPPTKPMFSICIQFLKFIYWHDRFCNVAITWKVNKYNPSFKHHLFMWMASGLILILTKLDLKDECISTCSLFANMIQHSTQYFFSSKSFAFANLKDNKWFFFW